MNESELVHINELAELRGRVMELQTKDSHTPQELAELDMLRSRVLDFQVLSFTLPVLLAHHAFESFMCTLVVAFRSNARDPYIHSSCLC